MKYIELELELELDPKDMNQMLKVLIDSLILAFRTV